jgi:hypothetical protein
MEAYSCSREVEPGFAMVVRPRHHHDPGGPLLRTLLGPRKLAAEPGSSLRVEPKRESSQHTISDLGNLLRARATHLRGICLSRGRSAMSPFAPSGPGRSSSSPVGAALFHASASEWIGRSDVRAGRSRCWRTLPVPPFRRTER